MDIPWHDLLPGGLAGYPSEGKAPSGLLLSWGNFFLLLRFSIWRQGERKGVSSWERKKKLIGRGLPEGRSTDELFLGLQAPSFKKNTKIGDWDFLGGPVVKNLPCNAEDTGSIPGWGTKIPHAVEHVLLLSPWVTMTEPSNYGAHMLNMEHN